MKILLLHSDRRLAAAIIDGLGKAQYEVHFVAESEAGLEIALTRQFDLIVMEWMFHKSGGLTILKKLRRQKIGNPVLIVTADNSVRDIVQSLDSGANDCVTEPFEIYVLIARMKALIRRSNWDLGAEVRHGHLRFAVDQVTASLGS
jgi:two-component system, OmpR family, response regulator